MEEDNVITAGDKMGLKEAKLWSLWIHLSTFSGLILPFGNFIVPFFLWIIKKDQNTLINHHGRQALNFQLTLLLVSILTFFAAVGSAFFILPMISTVEEYTLFVSMGIAIILTATYIVGSIALIIYSACKAYEGMYFRNPFAVPFLR